MVPFHPGYGLRELSSSLVEPVVGPEIVTQFEIIQDAEVRLACSSRKVVVPPCVLRQHGIHHIGFQHGVHGGHHGLIAHEKIAATAGYANPAAIEGVPHQFAQRADVLRVVAKRQAVIRRQLVI